MFTRERITTALLVLLIAIAFIFTLITWQSGGLLNSAISGISGLILLVIFFAHRSGWPWIPHLMVGNALVGVVASALVYPEGRVISLGLLFPMLISAIMFTPGVALMVFAATLGSAMLGLWLIYGAAVTQLSVSLFQIEVLVTTVGVALSVALVSAVARTAQREAEANAEHAAQQRAMAEAQAAVLAERTAQTQQLLGEVEMRAAEQVRLLAEIEQQREVIRELSVPVLPISRGTLVMPLVGAFDTTRLHQVQQRALHSLEQTRAQRLLLDVTAVPVVDNQIARGLLTVVQSARLLGAEAMLVGIRPEVAQAIVSLDMDLNNIRTFSDLRSALE